MKKPSHLFFLVQRETEDESPQGWKVIYLISNMDAIYILEHTVTANHIQKNTQSYVFEEFSLHFKTGKKKRHVS